MTFVESRVLNLWYRRVQYITGISRSSKPHYKNSLVGGYFSCVCFSFFCHPGRACCVLCVSAPPSRSRSLVRSSGCRRRRRRRPCALGASAVRHSPPQNHYTHLIHLIHSYDTLTCQAPNTSNQSVRSDAVRHMRASVCICAFVFVFEFVCVTLGKVRGVLEGSYGAFFFFLFFFFSFSMLSRWGMLNKRFFFFFFPFFLFPYIPTPGSEL